MEWLLVVVLASTANSAAMTAPPLVFPTKAECEAAGEAVKSALGGTFQGARFVCISRSKS